MGSTNMKALMDTNYIILNLFLLSVLQKQLNDSEMYSKAMKERLVRFIVSN